MVASGCVKRSRGRFDQHVDETPGNQPPPASAESGVLPAVATARTAPSCRSQAELAHMLNAESTVSSDNSAGGTPTSRLEARRRVVG